MTLKKCIILLPASIGLAANAVVYNRLTGTKQQTWTLMRNTFMRKQRRLNHSGYSSRCAGRADCHADVAPHLLLTPTPAAPWGRRWCFRDANNAILRDGYHTTQATLTPAAGHPPPITSTAQLTAGLYCRPRLRTIGLSRSRHCFDLGPVQQLTNVTIFYADLYNVGFRPRPIRHLADGGLHSRTRASIPASTNQ